jgi:hypothetical protein
VPLPAVALHGVVVVGSHAGLVAFADHIAGCFDCQSPVQTVKFDKQLQLEPTSIV